MKRIFTILLIAAVYIVCNAKSCADTESNLAEDNNRGLALSKDSILGVFNTEMPDRKYLATMEANACMRLGDFSEYINLASDTSLDLFFRKQAIQNAFKLFVAGSTIGPMWLKQCGLQDGSTVESFLAGLQKDNLACHCRVTGVQVKQEFVQKNDSTFLGKLSFLLAAGPAVPDSSGASAPLPLEADVYACRKLKTFGSRQVRVWDVYLGIIY
jgi:hypothetical protein